MAFSHVQCCIQSTTSFNHFQNDSISFHSEVDLRWKPSHFSFAEFNLAHVKNSIFTVSLFSTISPDMKAILWFPISRRSYSGAPQEERQSCVGSYAATSAKIPWLRWSVSAKKPKNKEWHHCRIWYPDEETLNILKSWSHPCPDASLKRNSDVHFLVCKFSSTTDHMKACGGTFLNRHNCFGFNSGFTKQRF